MHKYEVPCRFAGADPEFRLFTVTRQGETEPVAVEAPVGWSQNAVTVFASHYMRSVDGARESSVRQSVERVSSTIARWAVEDGYFGSGTDAIFEGRRFAAELRGLLYSQTLTFNSPVWYNVGVAARPQCSACYIQHVGDDMEDIIHLQASEMRLFKRGSGTGSNLSTLRPAGWPLSGGGSASGPASFMRGYDAWAGVTKSGGGTRRAAKGVWLDCDHPDIEQFVEDKREAEKMARDLVARGWPADWDGKVAKWLPFQNANHSVRVTDDFMRAVANDGSWDLSWGGKIAKTVRARDLWNQICRAAAECGDPGVQFHDTINSWHTSPSGGPQRATNPCSEFSFIDDSACNLAHLILQRFLRADASFDHVAARDAVRIAILAQDVIVDRASYPTPEIEVNSRKYRPLGLGYAGLGALIMQRGMAYDSREGRATAAVVTSLLAASAWEASVDLAAVRGRFDTDPRDALATEAVLRRHRLEHDRIHHTWHDTVWHEILRLWDKAQHGLVEHGVRNGQLTLLAPTGTCGLAADCDSTGCEPYFAPVVYKSLAGGGGLKIAVESADAALRALGYTEAERRAILAHVAEYERFDDAPALKPEHLPVFDCAIPGKGGARCITPEAHVRMMAAVQPFLSGAISKTVNLPRGSGPDVVSRVYNLAWQLGVKTIALYVDGSKFSQPISTGKPPPQDTPAEVKIVASVPAPQRRRLPQDRRSATRHFELGGVDGYITAGFYGDGTVGEVFTRLGKAGDTIGGLLDAWAITFSTALQYGVPLEVLIAKGEGAGFSPHGFTGDDLRSARSVVDYVCRWLRRFIPGDGAIPNNDVKGQYVDVVASTRSAPCTAGTGCPGSMSGRGACMQCDTCGHRSGCGA